MARRFDITKGDRTTKEGTVIRGDSNDTVGDLEKAYEGDHVWCPACDTTGTIGCVGPRLSMIGPDGREGALSEDLCMCECQPSPRLIASQDSSHMDV